jgi:hypothetical protein
VRITKKVSTSMMHLFNQGVMINTVDSVVRVSGPEAIAMGASILALDHTCSSASGCATFDGTHNITVTNGNIISNSDLIKNGSSGTVEVNSGLITYHDDYYLNGVKNYNDGRIDPMPSQAGGYTEIEVDLTEELRARCSSYTAYSADAEVKHGVNTGDVSVTGGSPTTIHPGRYHNIENQSGKLIMLPGLYCIEDGFLVNSKGNNAVPKDGLVADNVTIFMDTGAGNFEITGNGDVLMHAPTETFLDTFTATPKPIQGLLLWHAGDNATGMVKITGTPQSDFYGSVVAPDTAIDIGGNAGPADTLAYTLQLVAESIRVHGNATINVTYDADQFFQSDTLFSQFR